jgi:thiol-disulfide isomerase/thioredoxin
LRQAQASGKPVAVHFHADWCPTCKAQEKAFNGLRADPQLKGLTLLLGRFARGAFAQRADRIPILKEKEDRLLERCERPSCVWRSRAISRPGPIFYADADDLERIIQRIVHVASDDEIVVEGRAGYGPSTWPSRLLRHQIEAALRGGFADAFRPVAGSVDCGPVTLLIFYFDSNQLSTRWTSRRARR